MNPPGGSIRTIPVGVALGSNLGDRLEHLRDARSRIMNLPQTIAPSVTSAAVYETEPVDCAAGTAPFLNTVIEVDCPADFDPVGYLASLREIEAALGRPARHPRNAARTVDLDLIYAGNLVVDTFGLTLPHPRTTQRGFVLAPLACIRPDLVLPGQERPIVDLLRALVPPPKITLYAPHW